MTVNQKIDVVFLVIGSGLVGYMLATVQEIYRARRELIKIKADYQTKVTSRD